MRRGQRFYHAGLNFTLAFPDGWELVNQPEALIVHRADQQALLVMSMGPRAQGQSAAQYLRQRAGQAQLVQEDSFRQADMDVATALLPGTPARRVATVVRDQQAYLFIGVVKGRASLETEDEHFLQVVRSFRPLQAAERKLTEPRRLHLVQFQAGQSLEALSKQMSGEGDQLVRLRLLNGLYPDGQPRPGDWLKMVR